MGQPIIKNYDAEIDTAALVIVARGAGAGTVTAAVSGDAKPIGITTIVGSKAGQPIDVVLSGITPLKLAGPVGVGDFIAAGPSGQGLLAGPPAGVSGRVIAMAVEDGIVGDVIDVLVLPGLITTPAAEDPGV
jgi:hypothetical protein